MIANNLKVVLATTFTFYLKAHKFHWNVMGPDFAEHHGYLGGLWEETFGAVDTIAEAIRTQGELSPGSFAEFEELSVVSSSEGDITSPMDMLKELANDNKKLMGVLAEAYKVSEEEQTFDISDMLAGRMGAHRKHDWMINSFLNRQAI